MLIPRRAKGLKSTWKYREKPKNPHLGVIFYFEVHRNYSIFAAEIYK